MKRLLLTLTAMLLIAAIGYALYAQALAQSAPPSAQIVGAAPTPDSDFARVSGPREWDFPLDHGAHTEYQTEWWYYTGNLATEDGRRFGYQLTFFRRALIPDDDMTPRASDWATNQIYLAHFAVSDVGAKQYHYFERTGRGAAGVAGAQADPYEVWLSDWVAESTGDDTYRLYASQDGVQIELTLTDTKGPILQGDQGYMRRGPEVTNASFYYSFTRLQTSGSIQINGTDYRVEGTSWMDHEFTTGSLVAEIVGWDWFSVQLDDGTEMMIAQLRMTDRAAPETIAVMINADGSLTHLTKDDFTIEVEDTWHSPHTQADYPSRWTITIPSLDLTLRITPYFEDQEQYTSTIYWEGAVSIDATRNGQPITGVGYVELTGYAGGPMGGRF